MQVMIDIPDTIAAQLTASGKDPARSALEALALEGYRTEQLTEGEIRQMLGYQTRMQVHALLQEHGIPLHFSLEEYEHDIAASHSLRTEASALAG